MNGGTSLTDLLAVYLYKNKYLSLPGLGSFAVVNDIDLFEPNANDFTRIPRDTISFKSNFNEHTDMNLVRFITAHTRKMESLAIADLFTITNSAKEMLNLYQPVTFEGIGSIKKKSTGETEFTPGTYKRSLVKSFGEDRTKVNFDVAAASTSTAYSTPPGTFQSVPETTRVRAKSSRSVGGVAIISVCVLVAAALIYFMLSHKNEKEGVEDVTQTERMTQMGKSQNVTDSTEVQKEEKRSLPEGIISYEVVFEHSLKERALKRSSQLREWGHQIVLRTKDSVHYTLAVPITGPAEDTTRVKDSIGVFFGRNTSIRFPTK